MWRHGDVFIARIEKIPPGLTPTGLPVLAEGELTGHAHRIATPNAGKFFIGNEPGERYFEICVPEAILTHEEHASVSLPAGIYRSWIQREYHPNEIRRVID